MMCVIQVLRVRFNVLGSVPSCVTVPKSPKVDNVKSVSRRDAGFCPTEENNQ